MRWAETAGRAAGRAPRWLARAPLVLLCVTATSPHRLQAQVPPLSDARLPRPGEVWFEVAPRFEAWHQQFSSGSEARPGGAEEPLSADFDGPLLDRLYPGPGPLLEGLNAGSDSLGFEPVDPDALSLGGLDFENLTAWRAEVRVELRVGVLDRLALQASVPMVNARTEARFAFDSTGSTAAPASFALPGGSSFVADLSAARDELQGRLDDGSLDPGQQATASQLLAETGAFLTVLQRKLQEQTLLPLAGSPAGAAMAQRVGAFQQDFSTFGIDAPALGLADAMTGAGLQSLFVGGTLQADSLAGATHGFTLGEPTVGLRFSVLDSYPDPPTDDADESADDEGASDGGESGSLRLRTTAAARLRFATTPPDESPFLTPAVFLDVPAGDGSTDLELAVFQDLEFGRLSVSAAAAYGIQTSDVLSLRVHPPDRPFALAATEWRVERDLGDYLSARMSSRFALEPSVRIAAEYAYWHKGSDRYRLLGSSGSGSDDASIESAAPLEMETEETRHLLGFGVYYNPAGAVAGRRGRSVDVGILYQRSVGGSGGQTSAPERVAVRFRVPVRLF